MEKSVDRPTMLLHAYGEVIWHPDISHELPLIYRLDGSHLLEQEQYHLVEERMNYAGKIYLGSMSVEVELGWRVFFQWW